MEGANSVEAGKRKRWRSRLKHRFHAANRVGFAYPPYTIRIFSYKIRMRRSIGLFALAISTCIAPAISQDAEPISDNSFLIEEAYNQEPGVVQHINTWQWNHEDKSWDYTFTQEWPVFVQDHQFSYTIPVSHVTDPDHTGFGDIGLNYRYQAVFTDTIAFSPRLSLLLPSGDQDRGLGTGTVGYQANLPFSAVLSKNFVTHWNFGVTVNPDEHDSDGNSASTVGYNYGASIVYLTTPELNFLVEAVGTTSEIVTADDSAESEDTFVINPGVRFALNFDSGLQIVPGLAFPIGVGPSAGEFSVFTYLSFEHSFLS